MDNKYELFLNLDELTKKVYVQYYNAENYEIIFNENTILFVKKIYNKNINSNHESVILDVVKSMAKRYKPDGVVHIDLSNDIKSILERIKDDENVRHTDGRISWQLRQAFTRAIISKVKKS